MCTINGNLCLHTCVAIKGSCMLFLGMTEGRHIRIPVRIAMVCGDSWFFILRGTTWCCLAYRGDVTRVLAVNQILKLEDLWTRQERTRPWRRPAAAQRGKRTCLGGGLTWRRSAKEDTGTCDKSSNLAVSAGMFRRTLHWMDRLASDSIVAAVYNFHRCAEEDRDTARVNLGHFTRTIYITDTLCARDLYRAAFHPTEADRFTRA